MKRKRLGNILIAFGVFLLLSASALILYNVIQDKNSGEKSNEVLKKLSEQISAESVVEDSSESDIIPDKKPQKIKEPPEKLIDDKLYMGIITIPAINLELPVVSRWNFDDMAIAPCRYSGTLGGNDLIIAGHNYNAFFKNLDKLNSGDKVILTLCDSRVFEYEVCQTELIGGYDLPSMIKKDDSWDMTLFTCTWSGYSRVAVRTKRI